MIKIEAKDRLDQSEVFAMSGLRSDKTGLPNSIYIWFSTSMGSHGPRIKVSNTRGKYNNADTFSVSIGFEPEVVKGEPLKFSTSELQDIYKWVILNREILLLFWYSDDMDDDDVKPKLKKI